MNAGKKRIHLIVDCCVIGAAQSRVNAAMVGRLVGEPTNVNISELYTVQYV